LAGAFQFLGRARRGYSKVRFAPATNARRYTVVLNNKTLRAVLGRFAGLCCLGLHSITPLISCLRFANPAGYNLANCCVAFLGIRNLRPICTTLINP
jgi:hypothetical protein